jgi:hypothetical protein
MDWRVRAEDIALTVTAAALAAACGQAAAIPKSPATPGTNMDGPACVSSRAPSIRVGIGSRGVHVAPGRLVTVQLAEPVAYASSMAGPPPTAFPWLPAESSDGAGLRRTPFCGTPAIVMSLPAREYVFRAAKPGRYMITARLNPAYRLPRMRPRLHPLRPARITVTVGPSPRTDGPTYSVTAPVLYRTGERAPRACLVILTSLPPAGCSGVPVTGYDFRRVPGLIRYGSAGWQTPLLHMVGTWNGRVLALKHTPAPASAAQQPPAPPAGCDRKTTPAAHSLMRQIGRARNRIGLLESTPCGARVWVLVDVADHETRIEIRDRFGKRVTVAGWLRP